MGQNDWGLKKTYKILETFLVCNILNNCQCLLLKDVAEEKL